MRCVPGSGVDRRYSAVTFGPGPSGGTFSRCRQLLMELQMGPVFGWSHVPGVLSESKS
jgi:hypothetical protein